jgi:hypothetical protein
MMIGTVTATGPSKAIRPVLVSFFDGFANLARYRVGQEVAMEGHARIANAGT